MQLAGYPQVTEEQSPRFPRLLFLLAFLGGGAVIFVEMVLFDVVDDRYRNEIAHTHLAPQKEPDLGTADIVLDELLDDIDVVFPWLQTGQRLIDVGATALDNKRLQRGMSTLFHTIEKQRSHTPYLPKI